MSWDVLVYFAVSSEWILCGLKLKMKGWCPSAAEKSVDLGEDGGFRDAERELAGTFGQHAAPMIRPAVSTVEHFGGSSLFLQSK